MNKNKIDKIIDFYTIGGAYTGIYFTLSGTISSFSKLSALQIFIMLFTMVLYSIGIIAVSTKNTLKIRLLLTYYFIQLFYFNFQNFTMKINHGLDCYFGYNINQKNGFQLKSIFDISESYFHINIFENSESSGLYINLIVLLIITYIFLEKRINRQKIMT